MQKLDCLAINEEGFVFHPVTGDSFQTSETGLLILKALKQGHSEGDIVRLLTEEYEVQPEDALRDIMDFRDSLKAFGLM